MTYSTTGTMTVVADDSLTEEEVAQAIAEELADELGIHPSDIVVTYDSETDTAEYTIYSDDAETLIEMQNTINNGTFVDALNEDLDATMTVTSVESPTEVVVEVQVTVDASNVDDVDATVEQAETYFENNDYTPESDGK